jgi:hypothetical protein
MLPTRLGINGIDLEAWLASEAVHERLDAVHRAAVEESVRTYGNLDLPRNLNAAFEAAALVARRDTLALVAELVRHNNELLAAQLAQLGIDTAAVLPVVEAGPIRHD